MSKVNIQDQLLYQARKERCPVKIYLISGLRLMGTIAAYDMYSVLLESQDRLQLIFKHAISTIEFPEQIRLGHEPSAKGGGGKARPTEPAAPADGTGPADPARPSAAGRPSRSSASPSAEGPSSPEGGGPKRPAGS